MLAGDRRPPTWLDGMLDAIGNPSIIASRPPVGVASRASGGPELPVGLPQGGAKPPGQTGLSGVTKSLLSIDAIVTVQGQDEGATARRSAEGAEGSSKLPGQLSDEEQAQVKEMKARDIEVRRHEAAHAAVGGQYASAPSYEFDTGPDGRQYAVSGEVSIDTSTVPGDPEATIRKMQTVKAAALAPAEPSGQDQAVAAQADAKMRAAQAELNKEKAQQLQESLGGTPSQKPEPVDLTV